MYSNCILKYVLELLNWRISKSLSVYFKGVFYFPLKKMWNSPQAHLTFLFLKIKAISSENYINIPVCYFHISVWTYLGSKHLLSSDLILQPLLTKLCPILSKVWNSLRVWSPCAFPADTTWLKCHPALCGSRSCFLSNDPLHHREWWTPSGFSLSDSFLTCSWQIFCIHACFSDHISHLYTLLKNISDLSSQLPTQK